MGVIDTVMSTKVEGEPRANLTSLCADWGMLLLLLLVMVTLLKRLCQLENPFKSLRNRVPPHPTAKLLSERVSPGAQLATIDTHESIALLILPITLAVGHTKNVDPSIPEDAGGEEEVRGKFKPREGLPSYKRTL